MIFRRYVLAASLLCLAGCSAEPSLVGLWHPAGFPVEHWSAFFADGTATESGANGRIATYRLVGNELTMQYPNEPKSTATVQWIDDMHFNLLRRISDNALQPVRMERIGSDRR